MQESEQVGVEQSDDEITKRGSPGSAVPSAPGSWSDEEKMWIVQESFEQGNGVAEVAERHGVPVRRLTRWRKLFGKGQLMASSPLPGAGLESPFAAVAPESAPGPSHVGSQYRSRREG